MRSGSQNARKMGTQQLSMIWSYMNYHGEQSRHSLDSVSDASIHSKTSSLLETSNLN